MTRSVRRRVGGIRLGRTSLVRALGVLGAVAIALTAVLGLLRVEVRTSLTSFLPEDDPSLAAYEELGGTFGAEPIVVLLETGDRSDPVLSTSRMPDILRLEGELAQIPGVTGVYGPATMLNQIAGRAKDLLSELMGRRDAEIATAQERARSEGGTAQEIRSSGTAARAQFDARYGPLLVTAMSGGLPTLTNQRFIDSVVYGDDGAPRGPWRSVVPLPQAAAIMVRPHSGLDANETAVLLDRVQRTVDDRHPRDVSTVVTGTPVIVSALSARTVEDVPVLVGLAVGGLAACLLGAFWIARSRRLLPLGVTLMALAVSLSIFGWMDRPLTLGMVAFSSVLLGLGCYYPTYFLTGARLRTVVVVAMASAGSLLTLCLSPMPLVRDIGLLLGVGVLVCLALALPLSRRAIPDAPVEAHLRHEPSPVRRPGAARASLAALVVLAGWGWWLLPQIEVSADVEHFAGHLPELADARHAEEILGSSGEIEVVLSGSDTLTPQALRWMDRVQMQIGRAHGDEMRALISPVSLLDFLGSRPTQEQIDSAYRLVPDYLSNAVLSADRSTAVLRYGVRLDDISRLGEVEAELRREIPPPPDGYEVELVGLPLVLAHGQDILSQDRHAASLWGIAVAGLILIVGLRRRADAIRAVAGAAIATGIGLVLLHVSGRGFDPVTIGVGALTVAVGAEFTVVRSEAVRRNSRMLRRTVGLVAATSGVGYLALLGSGLGAVRDFGVELAIAVFLAYFASNVVVAASTRTIRDGAPGATPRPEAHPQGVSARTAQKKELQEATNV